MFFEQRMQASLIFASQTHKYNKYENQKKKNGNRIFVGYPHMPHAIIIVEFWFFFHIWIFIFIYLASSLLFLFSLALFVCLLVCVWRHAILFVFFYYFLLFSFNSIPNDMKTVDNNHRIHTHTVWLYIFFSCQQF